MDIFHIYEALTSPFPSQHLQRAGSPFAIATALALLSKIEGVPIFALKFGPVELDARYPAANVPLHARSVFKMELTRYQGWRRTVFDAFLLDTGCPPEQDPISALMRIARLEIPGNSYQHLRTLRRVLPGGMGPSDLGYGQALRIDKEIEPPLRISFRTGLSVLDRLHALPLARKSRHLLPAEPIGRLPPPSSHLYHAPLPPRLDGVYRDASTTLRAAIPFTYRMACLTETLSPAADPSLEELAEKSRLFWEVDPALFGFRRPSKTALKSYIRNIGKHASVGHSAPQRAVSPTQFAWAKLRTQLRSSGKEELVQRTFGVSRYAIPAGLAPHDLTADWFSKTMDGLQGDHLRAFRSGAFALDSLFELDVVPGSLLPPERSGLERVRSQPTA
ncbi:hypothetical protein [Maricaulis maris]|uniref:hypothetical protein n=1 Tax=Maricaulis maris TaxID=74318 RepID=UPI003A8F5F5F